MSFPISIVCSSCGKDMGTKPGGSKPGQVTHSYCPKCYKAIMADLGKESPRKLKKKSSDLAEQPDDLQFSLPSHSAQ